MEQISLLSAAAAVDRFGGKAANLAKLLVADLPVPKGWAVAIDKFDQNGQLSDEVKRQLETLLDSAKRYAVRSSALAEDSKDASWAGLFETFLNVEPSDILNKIVACHNSAKARAYAYAADKTTPDDFQVAVIVQEMIQAEYAGVLFTRDPITGAHQLVTEYVSGLGEELVSGRADPKHIAWNSNETIIAPFDGAQLTELAIKVEQLFDNNPQDIEWAWADNKIWLLQTRPITTKVLPQNSYYLGEPNELFYWGPSRAEPIYMSDFMLATEEFLQFVDTDLSLPNVPKTLVLFHAGRMVWLCNEAAFTNFVETIFMAYEKRDKFQKDLEDWRRSTKKFDEEPGDAKDLVACWRATSFAEFSLYGAESVLSKRLERFDPQTRHIIWGGFTRPDNDTFMSRIDSELRRSGDPELLADKYWWIGNGYQGIDNSALDYFSKRLVVLQESGAESLHAIESPNRTALAEHYGLAQDEVHALDLARLIAELLDERKEWMMRTRSYIKTAANSIENGWMFSDGSVQLINKNETTELWERYIDFKTSSTTVKGIIASNGGKHFITGEIVVISSPTDAVPDGKILVVPSTSPSYVPLMRKAKALITDHGGMMSHAAIVAREFNLPCIVGTKDGTKQLKDGDHVVLDLVRGEVTR